MQQRGSDKHGPRHDEQLKHELRGLEQADHPTRAEEWRDPEPPADDDPQLRDPRDAERMTQQTVTDVMTPGVVGVAATAPITDAAELMREHDIGDVVVIHNGRIEGVITDRDLAVRVLGEHRTTDHTTVGEVCSSDVVSVSSDTSVPQAITLMRTHAIRRLPVIGPDGHALGMVSIGDLALMRDPQSALADISAAAPNV